jgi:predicted ATPase/DNA-binding CsgD family transcriptional regulator/transcriptional regulator with XRE-family HTH domain
MDDREPAFGVHLRRYRERAGLTQEALAERAGLAASAVAALERGRRQRPYPDTVQRLADALALSAADRARFGVVATRFGDATSGLMPGSSVDVPRSNLPAPRTRLIGREHDIAALVELLPAHSGRLVTLTGIGGGGKTRLALAVASELRTAFPDGAWLAEFAPLANPALVPQAVAAALDVPEVAGVPLIDRLAFVLERRSLLLVFDNCEHLIDACAALAEHLLARCPNLRILATSREPLLLAGERQWRVPPLALPDPDRLPVLPELEQSPAVQLFVERAQAIAAGFVLTTENFAAVAQVCARLEGIPLAIELAAAQVRVLAVEQILERLDDSLRLLTGASRAAPTRQQTLRGALDWSYDLLTPLEQNLFRRLAVFADGCDIDAAEAVCAGPELPAVDVLELLGRLVDRSLLVMVHVGGAARYRLLEPVRQYAAERLLNSPDADAVRARHLACYLALAELAAPELHGPAQVAWLRRLEREHDNLRSALRWTIACGDVECGFRLATALVFFWEGRGHLSEGRRWLDAVLSAAGAGTAPAALRARALLGAGLMAEWLGDKQASESLCTECLTLARAFDDQPCVAWALAWLGMVRMSRGDFARTSTLLEESLQLFQELHDQRGMAYALLNLGTMHVYQGDAAQAQPPLEESLERFQALGDIRYIAIAHTMLGTVFLYLRDPVRAAALAAVGLAGHREVGDRIYLTYPFLVIAAALQRLKQPGQAVRLLGAAEPLRESVGEPLGPLTQAMHDQLVARLRTQLDEARFEDAWAMGRALTLEQAVAAALAAGTPAPAPPPPAAANLPDRLHDPLTRREQEVARLLAQGYTDRQIAVALSISVRTVSSHVQHLLAKLDVRSRWQIADQVTAHLPRNQGTG